MYYMLEGLFMVAASDEGVVIWTESWDRMPEAEAAGFVTLRPSLPGTFGQRDYVLTPKGQANPMPEDFRRVVP